MATSRRRAAPGLGDFLDALETRLRTLGVEGIVAALIAHAERLPAKSRQEFLAIFPNLAPGRRHHMTTNCSPTSTPSPGVPETASSTAARTLRRSIRRRLNHCGAHYSADVSALDRADVSTGSLSVFVDKLSNIAVRQRIHGSTSECSISNS